MRESVGRVITFNGNSVIRDVKVVTKSKEELQREQLKKESGFKELIAYNDHTNLFSTVPLAPRSHKSWFYDEKGNLLYESVMHQDAMRYQPLPSQCKGMWEKVARMVTYDDKGILLRDATIYKPEDVPRPRARVGAGGNVPNGQ